MCKKEPVRLQKKTNPLWLETLQWLIKQPNFWIYLFVIIIFVGLIIFAIFESKTFFVYNTGGL